MATSLNSPSGVQVPSNHNWLGSNSAYSQIMPIIDPTNYMVWGSQDLAGLIEDVLGGKNYISGISYRHFDEDRIQQNVIAAGTGTGVVGATIVYTIDTTNEITGFPATAVEPYVATGTQSNLMPVRQNDILIFPNGAQGVVTVAPSYPSTTQTFSVTSTNGIALPTTTNADVIINMGVTNGEDGVSPQSYNFRDGVYYNMLEIMADMFKTTGTALGEKLWINYKWDGQEKALWWYKGMFATTRRFRNFADMKFVAGNKVTSGTGINAFDATLTRTEGLVPFCSSYNAQQTFNIVSGLTLADWQGYIIDVLDKNKGTTEITAINAIANRAQIESFIRAEMKNGGVQYGAFSGGMKQAVDFGFDSFQNLGYTTHNFTYQMFNDPTALGADGHKYKNLTLICPMNKDVYSLGERKEKTLVPSMRINYNKNYDYSREAEQWLTGGANGTYTNTNDSVQVNFRKHAGFEGFGANRFMAVQGTNS